MALSEKAAHLFPREDDMSRVVMEHIEYEMNVPQKKADGDRMFFLQIDPDKCVGCDTCMGYCPTGAIYGDLGQPHKISYEAP